nr:hypothetical protein [Tanacetum cinerariifolium]
DGDDDDKEVRRDDDKDDDEEGGDNEQEYDKEEEYAKETRDEESFDPIPQTPEDSKDEGDGEEDLGLNTPTSVPPLPMYVPTMTPSTIATITTTSQAPILPTTVPSNIIQNLPNFGSLFRFDDRLRSLEANFSEAMQTN